MWFDAFDCASWVLRAFTQLGLFGAKFDASVHLNYTRIHLYSKQPIFLGNETQIFGPNRNVSLAKDILNFYKNFQAHVSTAKRFLDIIDALIYIMGKDRFYLYYNSAYWLLPMQKPYVKITYFKVPLPGTTPQHHKPRYVTREEKSWKTRYGKLRL